MANGTPRGGGPQGPATREESETPDPPGGAAAGASFAERLDHLFRTVHPQGRGEYSYREVAKAIEDSGGPTISASYLHQLRTGVKDNKATEAGRGKSKDVWAIDQAIARGYAVATFYNGDVDPDPDDIHA